MEVLLPSHLSCYVILTLFMIDPRLSKTDVFSICPTLAFPSLPALHAFSFPRPLNPAHPEIHSPNPPNSVKTLLGTPARGRGHQLLSVL